MKNTSFQGVTFHATSFNKSELSEIHFEECEILGNTFFESAKISKATFYETKFEKLASFRRAQFGGYVSFIGSTFDDNADFSGAVLDEHSELVIQESTFSADVDFSSSIISGFLAFEGRPDNLLFTRSASRLDLRYAKIPVPERVSFHSARLRPSWFLNTDPKKFVFTACDWSEMDVGDILVERELESLKAYNVSNPHKILTKIGWQLADNFEESKSFVEASRFRTLANESKRREEWRGFKIPSLHWWYFLSSRYGESPGQAFLVLAFILILFAIYYYLALFLVCPSTSSLGCTTRTLSWWEAFHHSLMTGALQDVKNRATITYQQDFMVLLEKILVPVQAALFALAVRRRFMR
ncbi:MAG: pentapeptide repeat-containing protein [Acidobacteria bacterium]|nr:pentapeptide repeat-containing protein [Acidobacteriota bacterium]